MRSALFVALLGATGSAFALSCGDTLERDTVLSADLNCPDAPAALIVAKSGVTLDLAGHTIRGGADTVAVELEDVRHVSIRGPGRIEGAGTGIEATRVRDLGVTRVAFVDVGDGVRLHNSSRAEIANNRFDGVEGHAVAVLALPYSLTRGGRHSIHGNTVSNSEYGVLLSGHDSAGSTIADNRFAHIGAFAIQTGYAPNRVEGNDFDDVGFDETVY